MQRTMLAAVQAIDKRLIAHRYLMQISAYLAFSLSGLVKHLSPYTGHISDWISFALSPFAHKTNNRRCSYREDFNGKSSFNVYKYINRMALFCNLFIELLSNVRIRMSMLEPWWLMTRFVEVVKCKEVSLKL